MGSVAKSLWPEKIGATEVPEPVKLLREQGIALEGLTGGKLYGEVIQSRFPSAKKATYDFYIGVSEKSYRHKLFSIEVGLLFDYPVTIISYENKDIRVSKERFLKEVQRILNSNLTQEVLRRLLGFATP